MTTGMRKESVRICRNELENHELSAGLATLSYIVHNSGSNTLRAKVESLTENYTSMLDFLAGGGQDENRSNVQEDIAQRGLLLLNMADRELRISEESDTYARTYSFLTKNYGQKPELMLLEKWNTAYNPDKRLILQDHLFILLWTISEWSETDMAQWFEFLCRQEPPVLEHLLGAVFLSALEYPDPEKIRLIYEISMSFDGDIRSVAVTYSLLLFQKYKKHPLISDVRKMDFHNRKLHGYVVEVHMEIINMHRSVKSFKNERKEIATLEQSRQNGMDEAFMDIKLKYIRERCMNGLDTSIGDCVILMHSSPFMKIIPHWFLPFDTAHPLVQDLLFDSKGNPRNFAIESLCKVGGCDVDRYCLMELLGNKKNVEKIISMIENPNENSGSEPGDGITRMTSVIRNLYRFFAHSNIRKEMESPFNMEETLLEDSSLHDLFTYEDAVKTAGWLHEVGDEDGAMRIINTLMSTNGADARILYIAAECEKSRKDYHKALYYLQQLDLLDDENYNTLNNMQDCCGQLNLWEERLEYLQRMRTLKPDNMEIARLQTKTLMTIRRYRDALDILYMLAYESEDDGDLLYDIVLCAICTDDLKTARKYNEKLKLLANSDKSNLYKLINGHICYLDGKWADAISNYMEYDTQMAGLTEDKIKKNAEYDYWLMNNLGINPTDIRLIFDIRARVRQK